MLIELPNYQGIELICNLLGPVWTGQIYQNFISLDCYGSREIVYIGNVV